MSDVRELSWRIAVDGAVSAVSEINKTNAAVDRLKGNASGLSDIELGGKGFNVFDKVGALGGKLMDAGSRLSAFGSRASLFMAPISFAVGKGIKDYKNLDTAIRQVSTLTDEHILPMATLKKDIREISDSSGESQAEVAHAMYEALSSGIEQADVKEFVKSGIDLSVAGFTDLQTVVDATTTVLNAYGNEADSVSKIHDIFVKTQDLGKITVDELGKAIGRVIPTAAASGIKLEQLGASYSMLTAKGMNAEIATTTLNSLIAELSTNGSKTDKVLKKTMGKSFKELTESGMDLGEILAIIQSEARASGLELSDMFGNMNAGKAANSLMKEGVEGYKKFLSSIREAEGATHENAEKMEGDERNIKKAVTRLQNSLIDAGDALSPFVVKGANGISNLTQAFNDLSPEVKDSVFNIMGIVSIGAPVILVLGKIMSAVGLVASAFGKMGGLALTAAEAVGSFLLAHPVAAAAAGVAAVGYGLYKSMDRNEEIFNNPAGSGVKHYEPSGYNGTASYGATAGMHSHAGGLDYVPHDDYAARLHEGEMVLTKDTSSAFRGAGGNKNRVPLLGGNLNNFKGGDTYSPSVVINVNGNADNNTVSDIKRVVNKELEKFFRRIELQRV